MIDWSQLAQLRKDIGEEDFGFVVDMFFEESDPVVTRLVETPDPGTAEADYHFLKGSASSLGFVVLSDLCDTFEQRAVEKTLPPDAGAQTAACYAATKAALQNGDWTKTG
ncbi:MAG: Hpt domain-containing protein [Rhodobacteraceae bacterium]|nr:Hpt domain-containing protein [Paracoccaceae bacterium]